jgi:UDP-glucose 4-epimerase
MKILITGENSYVGKSFQSWINKNKKNVEIDFISIKNDIYKSLDFSKYSTIIHLAALVHKNEKNIPLSDYLEVNFYKTRTILDKAILYKVNNFVVFLL